MADDTNRVTYPGNDFNARTDDYSVDYAGGEVLTETLDRFGTMFDPRLIHTTGREGGIHAENIHESTWAAEFVDEETDEPYTIGSLMTAPPIEGLYIDNDMTAPPATKVIDMIASIWKRLTAHMDLRSWVHAGSLEAPHGIRIREYTNGSAGPQNVLEALVDRDWVRINTGDQVLYYSEDLENIDPGVSAMDGALAGVIRVRLEDTEDRVGSLEETVEPMKRHQWFRISLEPDMWFPDPSGEGMRALLVNSMIEDVGGEFLALDWYNLTLGANPVGTAWETVAPYIYSVSNGGAVVRTAPDVTSVTEVINCVCQRIVFSDLSEGERG